MYPSTDVVINASTLLIAYLLAVSYLYRHSAASKLVGMDGYAGHSWHPTNQTRQVEILIGRAPMREVTLLDVDAAGLYRGPLEDFVARRTALVRELRRTDGEAADAVGKIRKPSAGVWAIDQVAADDPALIAELLAAGADARQVQGNVAAGTANREDLRIATGRLRDAVDAAALAALGVLTSAGHTASEDTTRRIRTTLQAAATSGAADRKALWRGTLDRDLDVAGFGAVGEPEDDASELAALLAPLRRPSSPPTQRPAPEPATAGAKSLERRQAVRDEAKMRAAAERARNAADAKRRQAERLADEARTAADEATIAERDAVSAEEAARAARAALDR